MKTYRIPKSDIDVSRIAYGCMKLGRHWDALPVNDEDVKAGSVVIHTALENGITLFDHADIYARGKSEEVFGRILHENPGLRSEMVIQSKCGIRFSGEPDSASPQRYDFSYEHITKSVDGSLRRLHTDYLDGLLLHRPDPLVEPEEVARAFDELYTSGKVRYFGVSNHTAPQIALLQSYIKQPLVINQVQLSLLHPYLIDEGLLANQNQESTALASGLLDYCRLHRILIQAWGPVAGGQLISPNENASDNVKTTASIITSMSLKYNVTKEAVALGWLLYHPAGIQPIIGTSRPERVIASCMVDDLHMDREMWYSLYIAGRGRPLP